MPPTVKSGNVSNKQSNEQIKQVMSNYTYTPPALVEEDQKQYQQSSNNNAQAQATAQAQALAKKQQEEAQAKAAAQAQALAAQQEQERLAQAKAQQDALAAEIAAQQRAQAEAKKLEQINTAAVTPAATKRSSYAYPNASESTAVQKTTTPAAYYWRGTNINNIDYKYTNPIAGTITPATKTDEKSSIVLPGANAVRNITDKVRDAASLIYASSPQQVRNYAETSVSPMYRNPVTPGLARVENINIPNTKTPQQSNADRLMNIAANTPTRDFMMGTKSYAERAALEKQINTAAQNANVSSETETPSQSINRPAGSITLKSSYGQGASVVKAPYKQGGYTEAELIAMGNERYGKRYDNKGTYEGYYLAPDGNYYPVDQGKANWALAHGMTDPSQYWLYEGYTPDKEAYRNVMGTYDGYTPSWRTTVYANASGAGKGGTWNYNPSSSSDSSAYGSGYSGDVAGQQRYFNSVVNWNV